MVGTDLWVADVGSGAYRSRSTQGNHDCSKTEKGHDKILSRGVSFAKDYFSSIAAFQEQAMQSLID